MSDTVFYNKIKTLLDQLDILFHQDWEETRRNLGESSINQYIDPAGSFLEPEGDEANGSWKGRDQFLNAYRGAVVAMMRMERGITASQSVRPHVESTPIPGPTDTSAPISVYPASGIPSSPKPSAFVQPMSAAASSAPVSKSEKTSVNESIERVEVTEDPTVPANTSTGINVDSYPIQAKAERVEPSVQAFDEVSKVEPANSKMGESSGLESTVEDAVELNDKEPKVPSSMPKMPGMGMPKPATGPQGFPSAFGKAPGVKSGESSKIEASTGKVVFAADPKVEEERKVREKFAHLLVGVHQEKIRDFILADGSNTNTGKPSMIIYIPAGIWLEFAFDLEEGRRILNKYPQRDPELIEFMKATGHSE